MEENKIYKTDKLGNCILDIAAGPFGSNLKVECFVPYGFPIIDGANLKGFKVTDNVTKFVTEQKARSLHRSIARRNDVIVTISGNVGQISYIPEDSEYEEYLVSQRQFRATFDTTKVYVPFLVYYFHTLEGQHKILSFANQTGVPALAQPLKNFKNIDIVLPPISEQKRIAAILESLDDKIKINKRINDNFYIQKLKEILLIWVFTTLINDNLEQQGQLLFEEFVMNPNKLRTQLLSDYALINPTRTIAKGRAARCIDMSSLPTKGTFPNDWTYKEYNGGMKFQNGDTIMARITPCLENGKTAYINFLDENEVAFGSTEYIVLSAQEGICCELFYFLARHDDFVSYSVAHMNGSSGRQRVSGNDIANYTMPEITNETMVVIGEKLHGIMEVIKNNSLESRRLAEIRDALLPQLISGELKVNELNV